MQHIEQTLLEQMHINDIELANRMELLSLTHSDLKKLTTYRNIIEKDIDGIVDKFYEKQVAVEEISMLIGDADTLLRLKSAQKRYIIDLFSGHYDSEYVNNRLRIGMVHKRIGVQPKLYLSAVRTLKYIIINQLKKEITNSEELYQVIDTLDKLLHFDTTLVVDTYIASLLSEIKIAKNKTEIYATSLEKEVVARTKQLKEQVRRDPLTSLYNQRALYELFRRELIALKRSYKTLSFIYFDIDNFKYINDTYGHTRGDEILKTISSILLKNFRETDIVCRYGGDEFCIILPDANIENSSALCQKVIEKFEKECQENTLSIGIVEITANNTLDMDTIINMADTQMYRAKKEQGSYICT